MPDQDPTGVLDLVRAARLHMCDDFQCTAYEDYGKLARNALEPLVEALVAQDDFYAHSADCVDEDCRSEERLEAIAMSKRYIAFTILQEQLQEKAGA